jgi:chromosome segregation ATPase
MGRVGEAMKDFWEGVGGFLSLGGQDVANKFSILAGGAKVRAVEKAISAKMIELGRAAWDKGLQFSDSVPVIERIKSLETALRNKSESVQEIESRMKELEEQRRKHIAHYHGKISEQLELKRPVDTEKTSLLAEAKRLQRELSATQKEIENLSRKIELQSRKLEEIGNAEKDQSTEYLRAEIKQEIEFNQRTRELKQEKISFLKSRLDEHTRRAEKVNLVVEQYEKQIAELRSNEREGTQKTDSSIHRLQSSRSQIDRELQGIKNEMEPLFRELGMELQKRPFGGVGLESIYSDLNKLLQQKDEQLRHIAKRRADSASISFGIKLGFYGMIFGILALLIFLLIIAVF